MAKSKRPKYSGSADLKATIRKAQRQIHGKNVPGSFRPNETGKKGPPKKK